MNKIGNYIIVGGLALSPLACLHADTLSIETEVLPESVFYGHRFEVPIYLNSNQEKSNGLGIVVTFDSKKVSFDTISHTFAPGLLAASSAPEADQNNIDGDSATDSLLRIAWLDHTGNWQGVGQDKTHLVTLEFSAIADEAENPSYTTHVTVSPTSSRGDYWFDTARQAINVVE
jgi:hypothetical protein